MAYQFPNPVQASDHVLALLDRLHRQSEAQEATFDITKHAGSSQDFKEAVQDKFIALDQDKCHCLYTLCRALNAKNIVEAGTSFGVSTMYLGLAVTRNVEATGSTGTVIGTEHEPSKAERARAYWDEAGDEVSQHIDLRVGDLRETLKADLPAEIDVLLLDSECLPFSLPSLRYFLSRLHAALCPN
jgi:predicted O-methyltransferase YrrM